MTEQKNIIFDLETTGLDPLDSRIVCVSINEIGTNEIRTFIDIDEKKVLTDFWETVGKNSKLIGFNSEGFDIPFLIKRSLINKIKINSFKSEDIRKTVNGFWYSYNSRSKGTLGDWAKILGMAVETDAGSAVPLLFAENKFDEIKMHCEEDIKITKKLYELCEFCNIKGGK